MKLWISLRVGSSSVVFVVCYVGSSYCEVLITGLGKSHLVCMCVSNCVMSGNLKNTVVYVRAGMLGHGTNVSLFPPISGGIGWVQIYSLTYSMVQSPSWEAKWFAASQEIPRISRNPNVHYRNQKLPSTFSILSQPNPVHIPTSHLLEIHPNIIHPSTPMSLQWSSSLRFPQQDPIHLPLLTHTRHMPSQSHSSRFYHPHNIGWAVQII